MMLKRRPVYAPGSSLTKESEHSMFKDSEAVHMNRIVHS